MGFVTTDERDPRHWAFGIGSCRNTIHFILPTNFCAEVCIVLNWEKRIRRWIFSKVATKHLAILNSLSSLLRFFSGNNNVLGACADELDMEFNLARFSWNNHSECGTLHVEYSYSNIRSQIRRAGNVKRSLAQRFFADICAPLEA